MGLSGQEQPFMERTVATFEAAGLWGKVAGCSLESQAELAAPYRYLARRRSVFALLALYDGRAPLEAIAAERTACVTQFGGPSESLYDEHTATEYGALPIRARSLQGCCAC